MWVPFFNKSRRSGEKSAARVPDGRRLYVIGDIHGELDCLDRLHGQIVEDIRRHPVAAPEVVYLGDYVDRGPSSAQVIDRLLEGGPGGLPGVHLKGNHEVMMIEALADLDLVDRWVQSGGGTALLSYGIGSGALRAPLDDLRDQMDNRIPARHRAFLAGLRLSYRVGSYLFVHAGIRPGVPLEEQSDDDMVWIRQPFLSSRADHGVVVVHGHTPVREMDVQPNRIGIDTGACYGGHLTCLVLEGDRRRSLSVAAGEGDVWDREN